MTTLLRSAPYFPVADVGQSAIFYEEVLGFKREYLAGSPPQFGICSRDGLAIMLRRVSAPDRIRPNESQGGTWDAFFWVDDASGLHAELVKRGATVVYGPVIQEAYDMREFAIRDRDGHVLGFGQALTGEGVEGCTCLTTFEQPRMRRLKALQRCLLREILDHIPPHAAAHGFRRGRSLATYLGPHAGRRSVLRLGICRC